MRKIGLLVFFLIIVTRPSFAFVNLSTGVKIDTLKIVPVSTSTPTQIPTNTVTPTTQPTQTPSATPTSTPTGYEGTKAFEATENPSSISTVSTQLSVTPTPTATSSGIVAQKDMLITGVIGLLIIVIIYQNWPKIKKWLHDKTNE